MKKTIKIIALLVICSIFMVNRVEAKSYVKDLFQAGDKVKIRKDLNGTSFIAGNDVSVNGHIDGIGFVAGNEVKINSDQDYLFVAGNQIKINTSIEKDAFIAGESIKIKNATLNRDAYLAANEISINGKVGRNLYATGSKIVLKGNYEGNVTLSAEEIEIKDNTVIKGTLKYNEDATVTGITDSIKTKTYKVEETTNENSIKEIISDLISSYVHITLLAIVLVFAFKALFKKSLDETDELSAKNILSLCGKGILVLIGVPIVALMLIFTGVFVSIGVISGIMYGILLYTAKIFTAYALASKLDKYYFKKDMNSYLLMIIGLLIIYVLGVIPYIGSLVTFLSLIIGLGIVSNMLIKLRSKKD